MSSRARPQGGPVAFERDYRSPWWRAQRAFSVEWAETLQHGSRACANALTRIDKETYVNHPAQPAATRRPLPPAMLDALRARHGYALVQVEYNNAFLVPEEVSPVRSRPVAEVYREGYLARPDRLMRLPWNREMEYLQGLPPEQVVAQAPGEAVEARGIEEEGGDVGLELLEQLLAEVVDQEPVITAEVGEHVRQGAAEPDLERL